MISGKPVSKIVREILDQDPSLIHTLQQRKTAQKEIAERIMHELLDRGLFLEKDQDKLKGNIAVAITRYLKKLRQRQEELLGVKRVHHILRKGTTEVVDGQIHYKLNFRKDTDIISALSFILDQLDQESISNVSFPNRNGVELYTKKMAEEAFLSQISELNVVEHIKLQDSLSHLRLMLPQEAEKIPGILAHVSSLLADQAISLYRIHTVHQLNQLVVTFVISEEHASKARDILLKLNNAKIESGKPD
ncbi:MAG: hypothetical protein ACFFE8_07015 [Candidatus Heimdallarchaeota archaeon]